jgi:hypothetical protein
VLPVQARLVALRKPEGAAEVLLAFLPFADEDSVQDEVRAALTAVAVRGGKVDPVIVKALEDKLPVRRSAAAEALAAVIDQRPAVHKLLQDTEPLVRLRVALALAGAREKEAVPVLIDLLGELPTEKGTQAEVFLRAVVGERAPNVYLGSDDESRKKTKEAWQAWWKANGATVDLGRPSTAPRLLGYTLIVSSDFNRISEIGLDGKVRWQMDNLGYPRDAQALPGDRVLIAEQNINRVVEMNQKREVLWSKQLNGPPVACQRLPNGNTFIAMQNGIIEVDRSGKEVFTHGRPNHDIMAAYKAGNGQIIFLTSAGLCVRLDASGKELKSFATGQSINWTSGLDVLPNGRILVSHHDRGRVVEYDLDGRPVWEATAPQLTTPTRLSNGNTLIASHSGMRAYELDPRGKIVWEYKDSYHQFRARRR